RPPLPRCHRRADDAPLAHTGGLTTRRSLPCSFLQNAVRGRSPRIPAGEIAMSSDGSVTHWISLLKAGEQAAAQPLWEAYFQRLPPPGPQKVLGAPPPPPRPGGGRPPPLRPPLPARRPAPPPH